MKSERGKIKVKRFLVDFLIPLMGLSFLWGTIGFLYGVGFEREHALPITIEVIKEVPFEQAEEIEEIDRTLAVLSVSITSHQFYIDNPEKQNKHTGDTERNQAIIEKYLSIYRLLIHYRDTLRDERGLNRDR